MKDKKNKFIDLARARTNKAIKAISLIGNLSNKSHYSYNFEQVNQITSALEKEIKLVKKKFLSSKKNEKKHGFEFR